MHHADIRTKGHSQRVVVACSQRLHHQPDLLDQHPNVERLDVDFHSPGFDLRQVQDVVDQA
jgi:hypothetical protein